MKKCDNKNCKSQISNEVRICFKCMQEDLQSSLEEAVNIDSEQLTSGFNEIKTVDGEGFLDTNGVEIRSGDYVYIDLNPLAFMVHHVRDPAGDYLEVDNKLLSYVYGNHEITVMAHTASPVEEPPIEPCQITIPKPVTTISPPIRPDGKYLRRIYPIIDGDEYYVDIYRVLDAFKTDSAEIDHAVKKLLVAGQRGSKDFMQDYEEAIHSIQLAIQLIKDKS